MSDPSDHITHTWDSPGRRSLCGLTPDDGMRFDVNTNKVDCAQCRAILDGVAVVVDSSLPPPLEWEPNRIGADERTQALESAAPLLSHRGKGAPFAAGEQKPPALDDLVLLAEYTLHGPAAYVELRNWLKDVE